MTGNNDLSQLGMGLTVPFISSDSECFRPPSWPPPKDWVWVRDKSGNAVSRYGDQILDLTPWTTKTTKFNFGDGPKIRSHSPVIDPANADLLRLLVAWRGWGPRPVRAIQSLMSLGATYRTLISVCSQHGILASDLSRFPAVIDKVAEALTPGSYEEAIAEFERARGASDFLGFELLGREAIARLRVLAPINNSGQTEYIPPRIWTYIVERVAACIKDYADHQEAIEACFDFCVSAYKRNRPDNNRARAPFQFKRGKVREFPDYDLLGPFEMTAERFGIRDLIERWVGDIGYKQKLGIRGFSKYLSLVQYAGMIDIVAFTLMRREEATSVRWNCLTWHQDPVFGRIPLIQGETTKTDPDNNALWITSPSVEPTILVLQSVAKLRLSSAGRWKDDDNPVLLTNAIEPWVITKSKLKTETVNMGRPRALSDVVKKDFPLLLDHQQLTITEDDLKIARAVCPTLNSERYQVGKPWIPAWHQFRRTGAVNMFASGEISDSSMQLQMKHLTRAQPLYYGRGNTALHLNNEVRVTLINAQYEATVRELVAMRTDRFVSPHGDKHKARLLAPANNGEPVNLISEADAKYYEKVYREHRMGGRLTVLGACMKNGPCDGDCVSSVGDCAGRNDKAPCNHVLFDRTRGPANQKRLEAVRLQLEQTPPDTPRYRHLLQEVRGLENYFGYINRAA